MEIPIPPTIVQPLPIQSTPITIQPDRDIYIRECLTPTLDGSTEDLSDKEANKPMLFRCLLLLLPVAIPVVVYLKDIDAMRRIFLTAFILLMVIVLSCVMIALLRRRRRNVETQSSNGEIARELAHRHFMSMTHRILPRSQLPLAHGRCRGDCDFSDDMRRPHIQSYRPSYSRVVPHYHLASTASRSPSPNQLFANGPLPLLSLHVPRYEHTLRHDHSLRHDFRRNDDPPSYEAAVLCPPEIPHRNHRVQPTPPETPPPPYETAVA